MADKESLRNIPSAARDVLIEKLRKGINNAKQDAYDNALAYTVNHDEVHRSASLISQGEQRAYEEILRFLEI